MLIVTAVLVLEVMPWVTVFFAFCVTIVSIVAWNNAEPEREGFVQKF
jgi:hypothetical protein